MIRHATNTDSLLIAQSLWKTWHHLKARQLGAVPRQYPASEALAEKISDELDRWLICECEPAATQQIGFFSFSDLGSDPIFKRCRFPKNSIRIENFALLLDGEILLKQFQQLAAHFPQTSILICIPSPLRDAYWAALKAEFRLLGESPMIVGTFAWLYLDREGKFDEIQIKLQRAKIIMPESKSPTTSR